MVRIFLYGLVGFLVGGVVGIGVVLIVEINLVVTTMISACVGGWLGVILAIYFNRTNAFSGPFLDPRGVDVLADSLYNFLIGFLPLNLTRKLVSRFRDYLEVKIAKAATAADEGRP